MRGNYRLSVMHIDQEGRGALNTAPNQSALVRDSEILFAQLGADQTTSEAILAGGVGLAGAYPIVSGAKLSDVLRAPGALGTSPYTLFGIISRKDPRTLLRALVAFTPVAVVSGSEDLALQSDDIIHPFTLNEARLITSAIRIYVQQRDQAEQALINPRSAISNVQPPAIVVTPTTTGNGTTPPPLVQTGFGLSPLEVGGRYSSDLAQDEEAKIQLIGSLTQRQLDMVASGQVRVTDFRYMPERNQELSTQNVYLPLLTNPSQTGSSGYQQSAAAAKHHWSPELPSPVWRRDCPFPYADCLPLLRPEWATLAAKQWLLRGI